MQRPYTKLDKTDPHPPRIPLSALPVGTSSRWRNPC